VEKGYKMMSTFRHFLLIALLALLHTCGDTNDLGLAPLPDDYHNQLEAWKAYRVGVLTEPTGWLRLVDLIWLEEGDNTFGSSPDVDVRFPEGTIDPIAGTFHLVDGVVTMQVREGTTITHEGQAVEEIVIRDEQNRRELHHGDLIWFIDVRGDRYGVRLFNIDTPRADDFDGFPFFETDPNWHLKGRFIPWEEERTVRLANVLGDTVHRTSPGSVEFEVDGRLHRLEAYEAINGLFIMFTDETGRSETFQAGRYVIIDPPDEQNRVIIDFNRAYNPPCAFSRFTTCHLPPRENRLDIEVHAGEKRPVGWDGLF